MPCALPLAPLRSERHESGQKPRIPPLTLFSLKMLQHYLKIVHYASSPFRAKGPQARPYGRSQHLWPRRGYGSHARPYDRPPRPSCPNDQELLSAT